MVAWYCSRKVVSVRYPHEHHGLAGRVSNSAKSDTLQDFLTIQVYDHSKAKADNQLGEGVGSYYPTHYFISKLMTIQKPKQTVKNYDQRRATSLVGEFNQIK